MWQRLTICTKDVDHIIRCRGVEEESSKASRVFKPLMHSPASKHTFWIETEQAARAPCRDRYRPRTLIGDKAPITLRAERLRPDLAQCSSFSTSIRLSFLREMRHQKEAMTRQDTSQPAVAQQQNEASALSVDTVSNRMRHFHLIQLKSSSQSDRIASNIDVNRSQVTHIFITKLQIGHFSSCAIANTGHDVACLHSLLPGHTDVIAEVVENFCRVSSSPEPPDCGHAGVIPPPNYSRLHQLQQLAF